MHAKCKPAHASSRTPQRALLCMQQPLPPQPLPPQQLLPPQPSPPKPSPPQPSPLQPSSPQPLRSLKSCAMRLCAVRCLSRGCLSVASQVFFNTIPSVGPLCMGYGLHGVVQQLHICLCAYGLRAVDMRNGSVQRACVPFERSTSGPAHGGMAISCEF